MSRYNKAAYDKILPVLKSHDAPLTMQQIIELSGCQPGAVTSVLSTLRDFDRVKRITIDGRPHWLLLR